MLIYKVIEFIILFKIKLSLNLPPLGGGGGEAESRYCQGWFGIFSSFLFRSLLYCMHIASVCHVFHSFCLRGGGGSQSIPSGNYPLTIGTPFYDWVPPCLCSCLACLPPLVSPLPKIWYRIPVYNLVCLTSPIQFYAISSYQQFCSVRCSFAWLWTEISTIFLIIFLSFLRHILFCFWNFALS